MTLETADQVLAKSNDQRLHDLHWDTRGPGQVVEKYGDDGKVIGGTTLAIELGWLATNFLRIMWKLGEILSVLKSLTAKVDALAAQPSGAVTASVDVDALVARLKAELPPATVALLAAQLAK